MGGRTVCPSSPPHDIYIIVSYHHGRRTNHHIFSTDLLLGLVDHSVVRTGKIIIYLTDLKKYFGRVTTIADESVLCF